MPDSVPHAQRDVLAEVGTLAGVVTTDAVPLRLHDASTYVLPSEHRVVRLVPFSETALARARNAIAVTSWLSEQDFPAIRSAAHEPFVVNGVVATVWHEVARQPPPERLVLNRALGQLVRQLHTLPVPSIALPEVQPLARLRAAIEFDRGREDPVLAADDLDFLSRQLELFQQRYDGLEYPLGVGLIHNDANPSNVLVETAVREGYVLTDWESAGIGPREMDVVLVGAPASRFGDTEAERQAFCAGYGYDVAEWPEYVILRAVRDLHSLAGHIRAAPSSTAARTELERRVRSLRDNDPTIRWRAV